MRTPIVDPRLICKRRLHLAALDDRCVTDGDPAAGRPAVASQRTLVSVMKGRRRTEKQAVGTQAPIPEPKLN